MPSFVIPLMNIQVDSVEDDMHGSIAHIAAVSP